MPMKSVIFFRHGKSDWNTEGESDHDRPLKKRGIKASRKMGKYLKDTGFMPGECITSSARRAKESLDVVLQATEWDVPVRVTDELYEATPVQVLDVLRSTDDTIEDVLVAGHEPSLSMTIRLLAGGMAVRFPTAAMARIDLEVDSWREVNQGTGTLVWLVLPKTMD